MDTSMLYIVEVYIFFTDVLLNANQIYWLYYIICIGACYTYT